MRKAPAFFLDSTTTPPSIVPRPALRPPRPNRDRPATADPRVPGGLCPLRDDPPPELAGRPRAVPHGQRPPPTLGRAALAGALHRPLGERRARLPVPSRPAQPPSRSLRAVARHSAAHPCRTVRLPRAGGGSRPHRATTRCG